MRGKCLSPCVPSSFMELVFCTHLCDGHEDVSLRGLTEGHSLINDSSCHALKSIATLPWPGFRMLLLSIYCATRTSSSGAPGGPTSPCMGSLGSRALQQHCWTSTPTALLGFHSNSIAGLPLQQHCWASTQAFFLPPLLYSGSDPHQPSSSVLVFSVSLLVRALIPPRGWHLHDPIFSQGPLTLEIRASTFQCWRVTFSSYQLPTKKISVILISYQN